MVKVICLPLALAHVSHFFAEPEPWAYKQLTHFPVFEIFENLQLPALLLSLPPRVALFPKTRAVGPQAMDAVYRSLTFLRIHCHQLRFCLWPQSRRLGTFLLHSERPQCCRSCKGPAP